MPSLLLRYLGAGLLITFALHATAQRNSAAETELQAAAAAAARNAQISGPADVKLREQAVLKLPAGQIFVPVPAAAQLMKAMGNRTDESLIGVVFPQGNEDWTVVIKFVSEGYIKDDDARDWNAGDLLKELKEGTDASNDERTSRGLAAMEVVGWAEEPRYDAAAHRLVWSASTRHKGESASDTLGVNYNTYALGREGYISLNLVTSLKELPVQKQIALDMLASLQYSEGKRYADFSASTDKVAAYGLAALVAGAAVKKLGLLAVVLAFLAKFAKVLVLAGGAAMWGFAKMFGKKKDVAPPAP